MAYSPASSVTVTSPADSNWLSLRSAELEPQVLREVYAKYGKGFDILDMLSLVGKEISLKSQDLTSFQEGAYDRPIQLNAQVETGSIDTAMTFYIKTTMYDTNGDVFLRPGDTLFVPGYYVGTTYDVQLLVLTVGASGAACTAKPLENSISLTTAIPANTYLQVGPTLYARGTDQPNAKSRGWYSRAFATAISKETAEIYGGVNAQQLYIVPKKGHPGVMGAWSMQWADADFSLDSQINTQLLIGQPNENTVVQTDVGSNASAAVRSTKGLWMWLSEDATDHIYANAWSEGDFDSVKDIFRANGVVDMKAAFACGPKLYTQVENAALQYIKEFSGGTNLVTEAGKVGFNLKSFQKSGVEYTICELASLSNQNTFGAHAKSYYAYAGMIIPESEVTLQDSEGIYNSLGQTGGKITIPNVCIGYLQNNGEDRKRVVKPIAGMNGMGYAATESYDRVRLGFLSEYALVANGQEQMIRILKDGTY